MFGISVGNLVCIAHLQCISILIYRQVLNSRMWLVATILDSAGLGEESIRANVWQPYWIGFRLFPPM